MYRYVPSAQVWLPAGQRTSQSARLPGAMKPSVTSRGAVGR